MKTLSGNRVRMPLSAHSGCLVRQPFCPTPLRTCQMQRKPNLCRELLLTEVSASPWSASTAAITFSRSVAQTQGVSAQNSQSMPALSSSVPAPASSSFATTFSTYSHLAKKRSGPAENGKNGRPCSARRMNIPLGYETCMNYRGTTSIMLCKY
jgi:hypothetical protein